MTDISILLELLPLIRFDVVKCIVTYPFKYIQLIKQATFLFLETRGVDLIIQPLNNRIIKI